MKYGEPWQISCGEDGEEIYTSDGNTCVAVSIERSHVDRAIACTAALAGVANPAAIRELLTAARTAIAVRPMAYMVQPPALDQALDDMEASLAALDAEAKEA